VERRAVTPTCRLRLRRFLGIGHVELSRTGQHLESALGLDLVVGLR
jgi:hypothetical protein